MIVQRSSLNSSLLNNVCEIRFTRRIVVPGKANTRRMWCTKSYNLLNSTNGRVTLNFRPPLGPIKINEAADNILVVWDILMQDYRNVSMDSCDLIQQVPADESFWKFFNENIYIMTAAQKFNFLNS